MARPKAPKYYRAHINDSLVPIAAHLWRKGLTGEEEDVDLTGMSVKFRLTDPDGNVIIPETTASIETAASGYVYYQPSASDIAAIEADGGGTYYGYFIVFDGDSKRGTFPVIEKKLRVEIYLDVDTPLED